MSMIVIQFFSSLIYDWMFKLVDRLRDFKSEDNRSCPGIKGMLHLNVMYCIQGRKKLTSTDCYTL